MNERTQNFSMGPGGEDDYIKKNYKTKSDDKMAQEMFDLGISPYHRHPESVGRRRRFLGLKKGDGSAQNTRNETLEKKRRQMALQTRAAEAVGLTLAESEYPPGTCQEMLYLATSLPWRAS